jgi:tripartite-type tricarboxylate transporter receptor subunit TctC
MRHLLRCAIALVAALCAGAHAQGFPERSVRVIIPYSPGGGTDNLVRTLAPVVGASMGHPLVIENKPGGNSIIGTQLAVNAPADGYTLLASDTAVLINPGLFKSKMPFDTAKSLTGVTMLAYAPVMLVTHPSVQASSLKELLAMARAKPGSLTYASGGSGASTHLAGELMKQAANVDILHVPFKGTGPATTAVLGGQVHMQFTGISSGRPLVESGKLRAIAQTGRQRNPAMPSVPTFDEAGLPGVDADTYWGLYAPAGTPPAIVAEINRHFVAALKSPALAEKLAAMGFLPLANSPEDHTRQMREIIARWTEVIDKGKITTE